jgi:flagellar hook-basal body complex protein FliE
MPAINFTDAINAYANAGKMAPAQGAPAAAGGGENFGDMMKRAVNGVVDTVAQGEQASMQAATGKADLAKVTEAINNAEVAVQTVTAIRDRVVAAYQDIMRMPI